mgnify:CR=1 FL=1
MLKADASNAVLSARDDNVRRRVNAAAAKLGLHLSRPDGFIMANMKMDGAGTAVAHFCFHSDGGFCLRSREDNRAIG